MKKLNKKTFVVGFAALVIAVGAAVNVGVFSKKDKSISELSLANMEALAALPSIPTEMFRALFNAGYDANYQVVKDRCPGGTIDCTSISGEISAAGYVSVSVTYYYQKR
jgi:hypothetical protein